MDRQTKVTGVILAGGLARRMNGQDKGLIPFKGRPMVSYAIDAMTGVADTTIINANRNMEAYRQFGLTVISDQSESFDGPLAGVVAALRYAESGIVLVMPCDSPFFRANHVKKLLESLIENEADGATAFDGKRMHPVFLAVKAELSGNLEAYLQSDQRKVETWLDHLDTIKVDFSAEPEIFSNVNSMAELSDLEIRQEN